MARTKARSPVRRLTSRTSVGALHEGQGDPVDARLDRRFEIDAILRGHGRDGDFRIRQADALAVGNAAADIDLRQGAVARGLDHMQTELAVVDQQFMAGRQRREDFGMRQADALGVAGRRIGIEGKGLADQKIHAAARKSSDAQLRPLQIDQNADRLADALLDRPDHGDGLAHGLGIGVAHIDAEHIGAGAPELVDRGFVIGGRAERGQDLTSAAAPFHGVPSDVFCLSFSAAVRDRSVAPSSSWRPCRCRLRKSPTGRSRAQNSPRGRLCGTRGRACT